MAQQDTVQPNDDRSDIDDDGVRIRGKHRIWADGPPADYDSPLPGLWIGHSAGTAEHFLEVREFGIESHQNKGVAVEREQIPKVVEALIERAYPRDLDYLQRRIDIGLENLEEQTE